MIAHAVVAPAAAVVADAVDAALDGLDAEAGLERVLRAALGGLVRR